MVRLFWRFLLTAALFVSSASYLPAAEVTLKSADGSISITGELLEFDGEIYRIRSEFGVLSFRAIGVRCVGNGCPDIAQFATDLVIGAEGAAPRVLLPSLVEGFATQHGLNALRRDGPLSGRSVYFVANKARVPLARIELRPMTSAEAFQGLAENTVDFAVSLRRPTLEERQSATAAGKGHLTQIDQARIIALDALVILVSQDNPVMSLTREQISRVFAGEIRNWSELGGADAPIDVFLPGPLSDLTTLFQARFLSGDDEAALAGGRVFLDGSALSDAVARNPFSIGFAAFSDVRNAKALALRGQCGIRQFPNLFSVQSGDYPLAYPIVLYAPPLPLPALAESFLAFSQDTMAQEYVRDAGFVDLALRRITLSGQQSRLSNAIAASGDEVSLKDLKSFVEQFSETSRLSVSFRFDDNSTKLDLLSRRNIRILADRIESGDFDARELIIAGFSDSQGGAEGNRRIALQRANQVKSALRKAAPRADLTKISLFAVGMGEISPIACNDEEFGRRVNRRVEIWLR